MPNSKIGDFFTPVVARNKRLRAHVSPGSPDDNAVDMSDEKVGDMPLAQLMAGISALLESKLDEKMSKLATKDDISNIGNKVQELVAENEALKEEICELKRQGKITYTKLVDLESRSRRNNLIFKGLKWNGRRPDFREIVRSFCREVLGCTEKIWVNRAHPLGRDSKAIIAHIPDDVDIEYILNQTKNLRGSGYVIHRDFPYEIRVKRSRLIAVRAEIDRVAGGLKMPLVHDHLFVKGRRFTWEEGKLRAGPFDGATELKSLFRHDFSEFLAGLSKKDVEMNGESPTQPISQSYAEVSSRGSPDKPSGERTQAETQGTSTGGAKTTTTHQAETKQTEEAV